MIQGFRVSLILPCLNEAGGLRKILSNLPAVIDEVVVADNGSVDHSVQVAEEFGARVVCEKIKGYGHAYQAGLKASTGDILVLMDADDSYPVETAEEMVRMVASGRLDFLSGCRFPLMIKDSMPWHKYLGNEIFSFWTRKLFNIPIRDTQSGMFVFRREFLARILPANPGMGFSQEIKLNAWLAPDIRAKEFHIQYRKRIGKVKYRLFQDGFETVRDHGYYLFRLKQSEQRVQACAANPSI